MLQQGFPQRVKGRALAVGTARTSFALRAEPPKGRPQKVKTREREILENGETILCRVRRALSAGIQDMSEVRACTGSGEARHTAFGAGREICSEAKAEPKQELRA